MPSQKTNILALLLTAAVLLLLPSAAVSRTIVTTILPLHSLVAGLTAGIHEVELLLPVNASPHGYSMRPSEARRLQQADLVVWIGPELETFLQRPLAEARSGRTVIGVMDDLDLMLLPVRAGGVWEPHDHGHGHGDEHGHSHEHGKSGQDHGHEHHQHHHGHAHVEASGRVEDAAAPGLATVPHHFDSHLWLAPENARRIANGLTERLSVWDPVHAERYLQNRDQLIHRIDALEEKLTAQLEPVRGIPFIVFHDAYQYFEHSFALTAAGSITLDPARSPGARRIQELRSRLQRDDVACLFTEPQFRPALALTLIEGTRVRLGELDPLGAGLTPGQEAWFELQQNLAQAVYSCLSAMNGQ